jgi:hypothetical protein
VAASLGSASADQSRARDGATPMTDCGGSVDPRDPADPWAAAVAWPAPSLATHTGFEDANSSTNVGIDSKATGQRPAPFNIGENLALLNNGSNGDSVPRTVPGSELVRLMRQRLNSTLTPDSRCLGGVCSSSGVA